MNIAPQLIFNVGILFVMMLPGFIMKKCNLATDGLGKGLSNLVLYIAQPALVFLAYVRPYDSAVLIDCLYVLAFSVVAHVIFSVVAMLSYKKAPDATRRMLRFATIFSNAAFMGIPLISAVLGDDVTIYASIYNITFNLFLWSLGVHICTGNRDYDGDNVIDEDIEKKHKSEASIVRALIHPVTIAAGLGLIFFFLPIHTYIPKFAMNCLEMVKALVAPLSMVVLGLRLAEVDLRGFFKDKNLYVFLLLRHFALPAVVFAIMRVIMLIGVSLSSGVILSVLIMACAPAATSATMFAEKYDCDAAYVSKLVVTSTLLSLLSMPLVSLLALI